MLTTNPMNTFNSAIESLLVACAELNCTDPDYLFELGRLLTAYTQTDLSVQGKSYSAALNEQGIPIELAMTSSQAGIKYRLVTDPMVDESSIDKRLEKAKQQLHQALLLTKTAGLDQLFDEMFTTMVQNDNIPLAQFTSGPVCLAANIAGPGVAAYIDARSGGRHSLQQTRLWLESCLAEPAAALGLLEQMQPFGTLEAVSLEGTNADRVLAKIYWRPSTQFCLADLPEPLFDDPLFHQFLHLSMTDKVLSGCGIMFSVGFRLDNGKLFDARINLCGHCLAYSASRWPAIVNQCTDLIGAEVLPLEHFMAKGHFDVSFLTMGLTVNHESRINCYVRPTFSA